MTTEEKARHYDKAVNEIRNLRDMLLKEGVINKEGIICDNFNRIFPELKESEDERIRKELINYLLPVDARDSKKQEWITWLEKKGEQPKKVSIWKHWKDGICGNGEGKLIYLIKNGNNYSLSSCLGFECDYIELSELDNLLLEKQGKKGAKGNEREIPNSTWSGEDESMLYGVMETEQYMLDVVNGIKKFDVGNASIKENCTRELNWLKSLRPQNNVTDEELAQAKKDAYNDALDKIEYHSGEPTFDDGWSAAIWYLKKRNTMPQSQWKPSEEQINNLWDAIVYVEGCNSNFKGSGSVLEKLYNDLEKLREE